MDALSTGVEMPTIVPPTSVPPTKILPQIPTSEYPNIPASEHMTPGQMVTLTVLERTGGCISLVATMAIFVAFALFPRVRNVQNTFIVFASVSNVGASIASVIAMEGLAMGRSSGLCQAQAFMFEMFMQSDPWWSLAMAINVFLVFFFRAKPETFRKWWWLYCVICYGGPFCIALALLLVRNPRRGLVYGEATIWCWVDRAWDDIRIYTYYMLIWICIVGSLILYFLVGFQVFQARNRLHDLSTSRSRDPTAVDDVSSRLFIPFRKTFNCMHLLTAKVVKAAHSTNKHQLSDMPNEGFYGTVITEVQIIRSTPSSSGSPSEPKPVHMNHPRTSSPASSGPCAAASFGMRDYDRGRDGDCNNERHPAAPGQFFSTVTGPDALPPHLRRKKKTWTWSMSSMISSFVIEDEIKRAYLRTSFLFALSVLVTWIPSSMNRIHSWLAGESPFEYHVATAAVLPLQGLWNAVIFFVTSSRGIKKGWVEMRDPRARGDSISVSASGGGGGRKGSGCGGGITVSDQEEGTAGVSRSILRDGTERDSSDADALTLGSDIELRRMTDPAEKMTSSL
ncbi:unnamed protein product [Clonostachys rhizophaga]|uniref:G-protein coupled receptors family 2 profile 2 domain-containing protein n=1 Tax=Clonostachys rhizophaga TaxID=160324 RepID=A0A9N9V219_9HYPO|nr:unnamed protein product [Clonostachys rhizophaga]